MSDRMRRWVGPLAIGAVAILLVLERTRPLRRSVESPLRRDVRNLAVGLLSAAVVRLLEKPLVEPLAQRVERQRLGLVHRLPLPRPARAVIAFLALDYTLYLWHVLTHRLALLRRFHLVHHADLDLTASTALRFHCCEIALSVPWRAAQVRLIGAGLPVLRAWQAATLASVIFHHSNLRLPPRLERRLQNFVVTPRMHGIHHSQRLADAHSNWSSGLTIWDRLHGTLRLDVPQQAIVVGVAGLRSPRQLGIGRLLSLPFDPAADWRGSDR